VVRESINPTPLITLEMEQNKQVEIIDSEDKAPRITQETVIEIAYDTLQHNTHYKKQQASQKCSLITPL
jgi:hypothetical protein